MNASAVPVTWKASDLVPIHDRIRSMQMVRIAIAAIALIYVVTGLVPPGVDNKLVALGTAGYLGLSLAVAVFWQLTRKRGLFLFGMLLIVDGVYLAWLAYVTGETLSPLRLLIPVHIVALSLLASYRTSLKIALWHSLLASVVLYAEEGNVIPAVAGSSPGAHDTVAFVTIFWVSAIVTASFSAVNERELRRRRFDLEALAALAAGLEGSDGPDSAAAVLVHHVADSFGLARAVVIGGPMEQFRLLAASGVSAGVGEPVPVQRGSLIDMVKRDRNTILATHLMARNDPYLMAVFEGARNVIAVPLTAEGRCIGVLVIEHGVARGSRIERRIVSILERFASQTALALRSAWLLEQVRESAATDGLTGIANRRIFERELAAELSRAARSGGSVALLLIDIDHFKQLNDQHGHRVGDEVLKQVAGVLAGACRQFDTAARYGGEEFAVIMPGCLETEALRVGERLRRDIAESGTTVPVTVSVGLAACPTHATDSASLVNLADKALYESKQTGRNRVTVARRTGQKTRPTTVDPAPARSAAG